MSESHDQPGMIHLAQGVVLSASALRFTFARGGGPGGQNVNKLATRATLTVFFEDLSPAMPAEALNRLMRLAGQRYAESPPRIAITAADSRSQLANRRAATLRLGELIERAMRKPKRRVKTRPSRGSVQRRLDEKKQRSQTKQSRRPRKPPEE